MISKDRNSTMINIPVIKKGGGLEAGISGAEDKQEIVSSADSE
jgi:hypothetical protein